MMSLLVLINSANSRLVKANSLSVTTVSRRLIVEKIFCNFSIAMGTVEDMLGGCLTTLCEHLQ